MGENKMRKSTFLFRHIFNIVKYVCLHDRRVNIAESPICIKVKVTSTKWSDLHQLGDFYAYFSNSIFPEAVKSPAVNLYT